MQDQFLTLILSIGGAILTATLALAGLILVQSRSLRREMSQMEIRLRKDTSQLESRLGSRMDRMETRLGQHTVQVREDLKRLDGRVARLEHGQAKLEGLLEGLRAAITRPDAA